LALEEVELNQIQEEQFKWRTNACRLKNTSKSCGNIGRNNDKRKSRYPSQYGLKYRSISNTEMEDCEIATCKRRFFDGLNDARNTSEFTYNGFTEILFRQKMSIFD
jgi:hypothetical protein